MRDDAIDLQELEALFRTHVDVRDRKHRMRSYENVFVGSQACDWMLASGVAADLEQALLLGNALLEAGVFHHVLREHSFKNEELFYRFASEHGSRTTSGTGDPVSWADLLGHVVPHKDGLQPKISERFEALAKMRSVASFELAPMDEHNIELLDSVHPPGWNNPTPSKQYNMVVIGAGAGGLVTAASVAGLGGRVALIEEHMLGGDCLNFGCVPSKALLRAARAVADVRAAHEFGVVIEGEVKVDFEAVMARMRGLRAKIAHHDSAERFAHELGVDVYLGRGRFTGPNTVEVGGETLTFAKAVIATGAQPAVPPIPGLSESPFLTNMTIFNLTEVPARLGIIGGGVIGCEMAQAFARFGSEVSLFQMDATILPREDPDASALVHQALAADGVKIHVGTGISRVEHDPETGFKAHTPDGAAYELDALLVATGRRPNVQGLGLEAAGVAFDVARGVTVDDRLQTSNADVYAVGDVATAYKFTHAADFMARMVVRNALFFGREKCSEMLIPWATYTEPEVAHVGLYPRDLDARGIAFETFTRDFADVDRAILEGAGGFVKVHVRSGSDEILGATIVGPHAGDMISEITVAMQAKMGLGALANVIHPYPTMAEAVRQTGDMFNRTKLTPTVKTVLRNVLAARR